MGGVWAQPRWHTSRSAAQGVKARRHCASGSGPGKQRTWPPGMLGKRFITCAILFQDKHPRLEPGQNELFIMT